MVPSNKRPRGWCVPGGYGQTDQAVPAKTRLIALPNYTAAFNWAIFSPSVHNARFNAVLWSIPLTSRV